MKRFFGILLSLVLLFSSFSVFAEENVSEEVAYYRDYLDGLSENYKFEVDHEKVLQSVTDRLLEKHPELLTEILDATADGFDKHTDYFKPEELISFNQSLNTEYVGIGVTIQKEEGGITVTAVSEGGPAASAGILPGDVFIGVDGEDVSGYTLDELTAIVRGKEGTEVKVTVKRGEEHLSFTVVRAAINQGSVFYDVLDDGIGYLQITVFNTNTPIELLDADAFFKERGIKKLIIDLRDNPGGDMLGVVLSLGYFVPIGKPVIYAEYKDEARNFLLKSVGPLRGEPYYELSVLVNGGSASGAELFAGNIQHYGLGTVVGTTTYGKGTIQEMLYLPELSGYELGTVKLTTGEYFVPEKQKVNGVGIKPDHWVVNRWTKLKLDEFEPVVYADEYKEGDVGSGVLALKERMHAVGYDVGEVNETYDHAFAVSVRAMQKDLGIEPTGVFDISTQINFVNLSEEVKVFQDDQLKAAISALK